MTQSKNININPLLYSAESVYSFLQKYTPIFLIISIAFLYVNIFCEGIVPRAIDAGLVLSGVVEYERHTAMQGFILKSPVIFYDFTGWMLALGLSIEIISQLLLAIPLIINLLGSYLIIKTISKNRFISLSCAILCVFSQIFFIWVDYPIIFISEHSGGVYSFSIITLTIGLLISKKYKTLGFLLVFNLAIHAVVAGILLILIALWILIKLKLNDILIISINRILHGVFFGIIVIFIYFSYKYNLGDIGYHPSSSLQDYWDWIKYWDTHRSTDYGTKGLHYIVNQFLLILIMFYFLKKYPGISDSTYFFIYFLLICLILYLFKPLYPDFTRRFMVNRIAIFPQFVIMIYIISVFIQTGRYLLYRFIFLIVSFSIFLISGFIYNNNILELPNASSPTFSLRGFFLRAYLVSQPYLGGFQRMRIFENERNHELNKKNFLPNLKGIYGNGLMVTTPSIARVALIRHKLPIILDPGGYDFVSYYPEYATEVKKILTLIYGSDFSGDNALGGLIESNIKLNFENKSYYDWISLSELFGIKYISVPIGWSLNLHNIYSDNDLQIYLIK